MGFLKVLEDDFYDSLSVEFIVSYIIFYAFELLCIFA